LHSTERSDTGASSDSGGFTYELALEIGDRDDAHLQAALDAVRAIAQIDGFWAGVGSEREPVPPTLASLLEHGSIHGSVALPTGQRIACGLLAIRSDGMTATASIRKGKVHTKWRRTSNLSTDWLELLIPLRALAKLDPRVGSFPLLFPDVDPKETLVWRRPIDDWLADIGSRMFRLTPFRMGAIGAEFLFDVDSDRLRGGIPSEHGFAYLWPERWNVVYYPATY
jgi:hypothetical protein